MRAMKMRGVTAMLAFCLVIMSVGMASAAETKKYRLGAHYPAGYFVNNGFRRVAERVKEETNGAVDIVLYESSSLGSYEQVFQEVIQGTVDMTTNYPSSRFSKKFDFVTTPSLASGYEEIYKLVQPGSPYHTYLKSIYEELGTVYIGSFVDSVLGALVRKGATVDRPYDDSNKAFQMRTVPQSAARKWWVAMGYQVATVPFAEVFSALQTGVIDGDSGSGPEGAFTSFGDTAGMFIEYPNSFCLLDLVISKKAWNSFSDAEKEIINKAFEAESEIVYKEARESYDSYIQIMKDKGIKVVSPTAEDLKFIDEIAFKYAWPETEKIIGPEVLQEIKKFLGK
jgi:TRAP-type C4-dicarboxylate transport system substrate-binding protein